MFSSVSDKDYIFNKTINLSTSCIKYINIYENWADANYNKYIDWVNSAKDVFLYHLRN